MFKVDEEKPEIAIEDNISVCSCACFDNETTCKCKTCCFFPTKKTTSSSNNNNKAKPIKKNKITKKDNENNKFLAYFYESSIVKRLGSNSNKVKRAINVNQRRSSATNKTNNIEMTANCNMSGEILKMNTYDVNKSSFEF